MSTSTLARDTLHATSPTKAGGTAAFMRGPLSAALVHMLERADLSQATSTGDRDDPIVALEQEWEHAQWDGGVKPEHLTRDTLMERVDMAIASAPSVIADDDIQAALFVLYASHYGSLTWIDAEREWTPSLLEARVRLEREFERELREAVRVPVLPAPQPGEVSRALFELASDDGGPSLAKFFARKATREQAIEALKLRSIYTLREADPHSWAIPRLTGRPKAALVEIQTDEYGGGRPERVHQRLFAAALRQAGLSDTYGAYVAEVPAITLASFNMMTMFGLNRRLIGVIVGHLAAFEMTSSIPSKLYAEGLRRLGFEDDVIEYFTEHVEADAVHEQIAARDLAGTFAEDLPDLLGDVMFGAAACLWIDGLIAEETLMAWRQGGSALRTPEETR